MENQKVASSGPGLKVRGAWSAPRGKVDQVVSVNARRVTHADADG